MIDQEFTPQPMNPLANEDLNNIASAARNLGLMPVRAWVENDERKASTAGAERTRRCREKAELHGFKQLSITLPAELHPMLKTLAVRTKAGESAEVVLLSGLRDIQGGSPSVESLPTWKRWLLRWLLGMEYVV